MAARTAVGVEVEYRHHRGRVSLSLSLCVERRVARETYVVSVRGAGVLITATLTIIIYGLYNTILDIYIVYRALRVRLAPVLFTERYNTIKHNPFPYSIFQNQTVHVYVFLPSCRYLRHTVTRVVICNLLFTLLTHIPNLHLLWRIAASTRAS